jgi:hypothetical protein
MEIKINDMCDWERKKAVFLMGVAEDLGISINDYGEVAVNKNSGYVYLWSEIYNFSLYMPISCELLKTDIYALWSCSNCGTEEEYKLKNGDSLQDIEKAISKIEKSHINKNKSCKN